MASDRDQSSLDAVMQGHVAVSLNCAHPQARQTKQRLHTTSIMHQRMLGVVIWSNFGNRTYPRTFTTGRPPVPAWLGLPARTGSGSWQTLDAVIVGRSSFAHHSRHAQVSSTRQLCIKRGIDGADIALGCQTTSFPQKTRGLCALALRRSQKQRLPRSPDAAPAVTNGSLVSVCKAWVRDDPGRLVTTSAPRHMVPRRLPRPAAAGAR
jgi:hypothetical protein